MLGQSIDKELSPRVWEWKYQRTSRKSIRWAERLIDGAAMVIIMDEAHCMGPPPASLRTSCNIHELISKTKKIYSVSAFQISNRFFDQPWYAECWLYCIFILEDGVYWWWGNTNGKALCLSCITLSTPRSGSYGTFLKYCHCHHRLRSYLGSA